jgi:hypothetical protein
MANSIWQATIQNEAGDIIPGAEITVTDEDTGLPATIFSSIGGAAKSNPFFADSNGFAQFYAGSGTYRVNAEDTGTGQSITWRYIRFGDAASRDVGTASGNVMEVGAFGLGALAVNSWPTGDIFDITVPSGEYYSSTAANMPIGAGWIDLSRRSADYATIEFTSALNDRKFKTSQLAGVWQPWQEIYHSGNLNPNVFGGLAAGDVIAVGFGVLASQATFLLPASLISSPVSITSESTFDILNPNFTVAVAGVSSPVLAASTSNKVAVVNFTGLSGLIPDQTYMLRTATATSKITVNP